MLYIFVTASKHQILFNWKQNFVAFSSIEMNAQDLLVNSMPRAHFSGLLFTNLFYKVFSTNLLFPEFLSTGNVFILTCRRNKTRHSPALRTSSVTGWPSGPVLGGLERKLIYTTAVCIKRNTFTKSFKKQISFSFGKSHNFLLLLRKHLESQVCLS